MRGLFIIFVLILVGAALGFYRGWFHLSTNSANPAPRDDHGGQKQDPRPENGQETRWRDSYTRRRKRPTTWSARPSSRIAASRTPFGPAVCLEGPIGG